MSTIVREMHCAPETVFRVLRDGWLFPVWVVGASRMRDVDAAWPEPGTELRHSVGVWPLLLNDSTTSIEWHEPRRMVLNARAWPVGIATVTIEAKASKKGCLVRIVEDVVSGPAKFIPRPLMTLALGWRNTETLRRLAFIAEGIAAGAEDSIAEDLGRGKHVRRFDHA
ncbi:SRPBCC family protein [Rarobacter faecitabidus]|uniref:Polyketide cyclase/dehydrase/lipid transport protein n=1 Tax=Rarobacter faecitabidus TaxID=13243 RepID=A0A542ZNY6_RARFA|nr:SRPBCC family protein [Rarobacter faecitabidus]TQL62065.1 hypothetical protein FB461_1698 [Rarobacter faecitabidus]